MGGVSQHIYQLREDFMKGMLSEKEALSLPSLQFDKWMKEAVEGHVAEAQAFHLATVSAAHRPSSRIVYLREFEQDQYYFYTNYNSRKGHDIAQNGFASMCFFWPELERQVRVEGSIEKAPASKSDAYFKARPEGSKIGAWSSPQSHVISSREALEQQVDHYAKQFEGKDIPRPEFWGGYVIKATYYEFWQGRKSRLHDRICYAQQSEGTWKIERLAP